MPRVVEIRSYNLKPGSRVEFHRLVCDRSMPMLERRAVDVISFGPSSHDETSYYLIRGYKSLEDRTASHAAFYGSAEWRDGPREAIEALIETYATIVIEMTDSAVDSLRRA